MHNKSKFNQMSNYSFIVAQRALRMSLLQEHYNASVMQAYAATHGKKDKPARGQQGVFFRADASGNSRYKFVSKNKVFNAKGEVYVF